MAKPSGDRRGKSRCATTRGPYEPHAALRPHDHPVDPLARLGDSAHLARLVPHLPADTLHRVIRHRGLDACEELIVSATPAQLASVLDLDVWRSAEAGQDERFDAGRFGEWLELLVHASDELAARTVADMDAKVVIGGLSRYVRVFDAAALGPASSIDDEPIAAGMTPDGGPVCEVGGYVVRARRTGSWDAIVALLLALDAGHPDSFHALMRGCRRLSNSSPEVDGLDKLLTGPEQLLHELAAEREDRRSEQGYITPADARAFLQLARQRGPRSRGTAMNAIAAACLHAPDEAARPPDQGAASPEQRGPESLPRSHGSSATDRLEDLLAEAGLLPERPRALLPGTTEQPERAARIGTLMDAVRDDVTFHERSRELAFLANALMAGCSVQSRPFTPQEASDAAVGICNLGLEHWPARWPAAPAGWHTDVHGAIPDMFLAQHDLVTAFEVGWTVLYEDVCLFVARQLIAVLTAARCIDAGIQYGLDVLRRELARQCEAGTPWRARDALDAIAMLDVPAWVALLGLLDACPVIPAALVAIVERRTGAISATEFEFISTRTQLDTIAEFVRRLPDSLRA